MGLLKSVLESEGSEELVWHKKRGISREQEWVVGDLVYMRAACVVIFPVGATM